MCHKNFYIDYFNQKLFYKKVLLQLLYSKYFLRSFLKKKKSLAVLDSGGFWSHVKLITNKTSGYSLYYQKTRLIHEFNNKFQVFSFIPRQKVHPKNTILKPLSNFEAIKTFPTFKRNLVELLGPVRGGYSAFAFGLVGVFSNNQWLRVFYKLFYVFLTHDNFYKKISQVCWQDCVNIFLRIKINVSLKRIRLYSRSCGKVYTRLDNNEHSQNYNKIKYLFCLKRKTVSSDISFFPVTSQLTPPLKISSSGRGGEYFNLFDRLYLGKESS